MVYKCNEEISACTLDCQDTCSTVVTVHPDDNSVSITGNPGPPARSLVLPRIGKQILEADPPIRFLLADGSNFVNQAPDSDTTIKAMETINFKVVIDAFMTDTAALADVILTSCPGLPNVLVLPFPIKTSCWNAHRGGKYRLPTDLNREPEIVFWTM